MRRRLGMLLRGLASRIDPDARNRVHKIEIGRSVFYMPPGTSIEDAAHMASYLAARLQEFQPSHPKETP